jgi:hypothetical protein
MNDAIVIPDFRMDTKYPIEALGTGMVGGESF